MYTQEVRIITKKLNLENILKSYLGHSMLDYLLQVHQSFQISGSNRKLSSPPISFRSSGLPSPHRPHPVEGRLRLRRLRASKGVFNYISFRQRIQVYFHCPILQSSQHCNDSLGGIWPR